MTYPDEFVEKVAQKIFEGAWLQTPYEWAEVAAFADTEGLQWAKEIRDTAIAALDAMQLTQESRDQQVAWDDTGEPHYVYGETRYVTPWS